MGAKFVYTQSDEISILLTNNDTINTEAWFDNNMQKLVSVSAALATSYFNSAFQNKLRLFDLSDNAPICAAANRLAVFDARTFVLPEDEVVNYFIWRQNDCTRNAILNAGYAYFSHTQLYGKKCSEIQELLFSEKGINFNDYPIMYKRGIGVKKFYDETLDRMKWKVDTTIPIFTQDRNYISECLISNT